ncbi:MAG TPA: thiamine pyrophosphate-dependent enzyme [Candidatus Goldiibacteriota bacterium]|nr:thiamine pyrophosphate-dependent enzyme [Candidatus Goldiibacteriota bacterium]HPN64621.1 thiamine pyrophosphate-dependent enzyme [Candidatus Goldiibacteriota bacterium]HRQ43357.1 thiamine pyrophosphate-dependent enzyme [Candidatus Goldiibacteriota bacterium]
MKKVLMSGDEAIARGAYEAGVSCGFGYPGTPSTEVLEAFSQYDVYAEWSINEKVALEAATGASLGGVRALVTMKHVGLNVALDAFMTLAYTGINGGLVIANADDPGMHSSQNEQDNRILGKFAYAPVIEPSSSAEARDFMIKAYEMSEQFDVPVLFRFTTRIAHAKGVVEIDEVLKPEKVKKPLSVPWDKYVMMPLNAKKRRVVLIDRYNKMKQFAEITNLNKEEMADTDIGFITSGVCYEYAKEVFPGKSIFKIGLLNPLPVKRIKDFVSKVKKVYVLEETEPYIEDYLKTQGIYLEGKSIFPLIGELDPDIIRNSFYKKEQPKTASAVPPRPPSLCADCGHRGVFKVLNEMGLTVMGDIGCYTLGALPPFSSLHTCIDMGSGLSHAYGAQKAGESPEKVVAVIGDSTFMHSGVTAIINQVYNGADTLNIILDNRTTAMTGRQPHPGTGKSIKGADGSAVDFEKLLAAIGVEHTAVIDPLKVADLRVLINDYIKRKGVKVIIARRPCALLK